MLGQASAIKVRNQVSEYPPLSKLAGCLFYVPRYGLQRYEIFGYRQYIIEKFLLFLLILQNSVSCGAMDSLGMPMRTSLMAELLLVVETPLEMEVMTWKDSFHDPTNNNLESANDD